MVYKDANVTVTAFPTKHVLESFGYRFDTPNRSVVISGDAAPTCNGCDILIHEVNSLGALAGRPPTFQAFAARYHTSTTQLAELASNAKPGLLKAARARSVKGRPAEKACCVGGHGWILYWSTRLTHLRLRRGTAGWHRQASRAGILSRNVLATPQKCSAHAKGAGPRRPLIVFTGLWSRRQRCRR